jgi:crossover junction endodeoxyribonuclease RuvC
MNTPIRILGLDPGLQRTGWGIIRCEGTRTSYIAHGVIAPLTSDALADRLGHLVRELDFVLAEHGPTETAIEETFMANNARSALLLGHARGALMARLSVAGLPVAEYAARFVKKALVGAGAAEKDQVAFMVRRMLPAAGNVNADAADALAVALTHAACRGTSQFREGGAA